MRSLEGVRLRGDALSAGRGLKGRQDACPTKYPVRCCGAGFQPAHGTMTCVRRTLNRSPDTVSGFFQPGPSGPPPASQRRPNSAVIGDWGRSVTTLLGRRRPRKRPGEMHRDALPRGLPGTQLCGACHQTGGSFLHNSEPGTPRWVLVLRVLGALSRALTRMRSLTLPLPLSLSTGIQRPRAH